MFYLPFPTSLFTLFYFPRNICGKALSSLGTLIKVQGHALFPIILHFSVFLPL